MNGLIVIGQVLLLAHQVNYDEYAGRISQGIILPWEEYGLWLLEGLVTGL